MRRPCKADKARDSYGATEKVNIVPAHKTFVPEDRAGPTIRGIRVVGLAELLQGFERLYGLLG